MGTVVEDDTSGGIFTAALDAVTAVGSMVYSSILDATSGPSGARDVYVAGPGGHICTVPLDGRSTVQDLKAKIHASAGIPTACQQLFHGLEELEASGALPEGGGALELLLVRQHPWRAMENLPVGTKVQVTGPDCFEKTFLGSCMVSEWSTDATRYGYYRELKEHAGKSGTVLLASVARETPIHVMLEDGAKQWFPWELLLLKP